MKTTYKTCQGHAWRQKNVPFATGVSSKTRRLEVLGLGVMLLIAPELWAQSPPDAGRALREVAPDTEPPRLSAEPPSLAVPVRPALPTPPSTPGSSVSFVLREVSFTGNTVFSDGTLEPLVAGKIGQPVNLADLQTLAAQVTDYYQRAGYVLTQVVVPPQDVGSGRVQFSVIEGRLGRIRIERLADIAMPESAITPTLVGLQPGKPLNQKQLERAMLLLSDLPGLAPESSLESGNEPGTFDLIIELKPAPRVNFSVDTDNYGSRVTNEYRLGGFARINSPFGLRDNLDLRLLSSIGTGLTFGRVSYELPLGYSGLRASAAYSYLDYELGKDLEALGASGKAKVYEVALTYPFVRSRTQNLFGKLTIDDKKLFDNIAVVAQTSDKRLRSVGAGFVYEGRDALGLGGYTNAGMTAYFGKLNINSARDLALDQTAGGLNTQGRYTRIVYQASRLQALSSQTSALLALAGQLANKNLDSAEKISAGGPRAVRAYSASAGIGDEGHILNAEYRWSFRPDAVVSVFYDAGWVRFNRDSLPGLPNSRTLRGYGMGLFWNPASGVSLRTSLAWRVSDSESSGNDRNPRLYAQLVKIF